MTLNQKKIAALIIIGILFSIIGWELPISTTTGVQWVVNNTNLAPDAGAPHPPGTGERVSGVTYWANNSPIQIFVYAHASTVADTAEIHLSINGTIVADTSGRPIGGAESSNKTIIATIPQYANYSVEFLNFHHYEWREYPILTGEVTTNITTTSTGTGAGCEGNCSFDGIWVNSIRKNNTSDDYGVYINISSPLKKKSSLFPGMESFLFFNDGEYFLLESTNTTTGVLSRVEGTPEHLTLEATDGSTTNMRFNYNNITTNIDTRTYIQNESEFNFGNANITNINNILLSGNIYMNNGTINNISQINRNGYESLDINNNGSMNFNKVDIYNNSTQIVTINTPKFSYVFNGGQDPDLNANNLVQFWTFSNASASTTNFFQGVRTRGSYDITNRTATMYPPIIDDILFRVASASWKGNSLSGSTATIDYTVDGTFNDTSTPTRISMSVVPNGSTTISTALTIKNNTDINIPTLTGVGNAYVCVYPNGTLFRGTPGC